MFKITNMTDTYIDSRCINSSNWLYIVRAEKQCWRFRTIGFSTNQLSSVKDLDFPFDQFKTMDEFEQFITWPKAGLYRKVKKI